MKNYGYTLLELLITLTILSIIILFAVPSFKNFFAQSDADILRMQIFKAILLARNEAMTLGSRVTLCASNNQKTCSGQWQEGFIITANQKVLYSFQNHYAGILHLRIFPKSSHNAWHFLPSGFPHAENGTFWYCVDDKNPLWAIMITQSGRARLQKPDRFNHVVDSGGRLLTCRFI